MPPGEDTIRLGGDAMAAGGSDEKVLQALLTYRQYPYESMWFAMSCWQTCEPESVGSVNHLDERGVMARSGSIAHKRRHPSFRQVNWGVLGRE